MTESDVSMQDKMRNITQKIKCNTLILSYYTFFVVVVVKPYTKYSKISLKD